MKTNRKQLLLNYIFIVSILLLAINDHILKWEFHNWFTGKFSDFLGLLILPLLISFFNPKHIKFNLLLSALLFMFWKSSLATGLIAQYNKIAFIKTSRVVDYTDYLALIMLPLAYYIIKDILNNESIFTVKFKLNPAFVLIPSLFILIAEAPPKKFYLMNTDRSFKCVNCNFTIPLKQEKIMEKLEQLDIKTTKDINHTYPFYNEKKKNKTGGFSFDNLHYYRIDRLIIEQDTLKNVDFSMYNLNEKETKVYFNGFDYDKKISSKRMKRKLEKHYRKLLFSYLLNL